MADYPTNDQCIFCKIIAGEIPCHKLYENDQVLAFLDIEPLSKGHLLLIPKGHYPTIDLIPEHTASACGQVFPKLAQALKNVVGIESWNILQNNGPYSGQLVPHVHFHFIPRSQNDSLGYRWHPNPIDHDAAKILAQNIAKQL